MQQVVNKKGTEFKLGDSVRLAWIDGIWRILSFEATKDGTVVNLRQLLTSNFCIPRGTRERQCHISHIRQFRLHQVEARIRQKKTALDMALRHYQASIN